MADFDFKDRFAEIEYRAFRFAMVFVFFCSLIGFVEYKTGIFAKISALLGR